VHCAKCIDPLTTIERPRYFCKDVINVHVYVVDIHRHAVLLLIAAVLNQLVVHREHIVGVAVQPTGCWLQAGGPHLLVYCRSVGLSKRSIISKGEASCT